MLLPDTFNARPRHWLDDNPPLEVYRERMGDWEGFLAHAFQIDREAVLQSNEAMHALVDRFLAAAPDVNGAKYYLLMMLALECDTIKDGSDTAWLPDVILDADIHRAVTAYFAYESDTLFARGIVLSHILDELRILRFQP